MLPRRYEVYCRETFTPNAEIVGKFNNMEDCIKCMNRTYRSMNNSNPKHFLAEVADDDYTKIYTFHVYDSLAQEKYLYMKNNSKMELVHI